MVIDWTSPTLYAPMETQWFGAGWNQTARERAFSKLGELDMGPGNATKPVTELAELSGAPADVGAEALANKGVANGYAALDATGDIDPSQLAGEWNFIDNEL